MNYNQQRVGRNIRFLRKKLHMNINQLAKAVSITPSFLGLVERGERGLRIENICKLSSVFGVSLDELIYGDYSNESGAHKANEEASDVLFKEIDAFMRGASLVEAQFIVKIIREIRTYSKTLTSEKTVGSGGDILY